MVKRQNICLKKVQVNNLKGVDLELVPNELIVFTGVSGSGKTSLAFETIYVEGQRRYIESLSTYARRYLGDLSKPDAESITGISPTIAIEQKSVGKNPRSTVGTLTGIYDFLRVLYAKIGTFHCPVSGEAVSPQSQEDIIHQILTLPNKTKAVLLAPYIKAKKGSLKDDFAELLRKGYMRVRLDGKIIDLSDEVSVNESKAHDVDLVIDRFVIEKENESRIKEAILQGLELGKGVVVLLDVESNKEQLFSKYAYSKESKLSYAPLEPQDFSFNHPRGMCEDCEGLGYSAEFNLDLIIDEEKSISEDCCSIAGSYNTVKWGNIYNNLGDLYNFDVDTPWKDLPKNAQKIFLYGTRKKWLRMRFVHPETKKTWTDYIKWKGVLFEGKKKMAEAKSELYREKMKKLMKLGPCTSCEGSRLKPYPSATKLKSKTIHEVIQMTCSEALDFFEKIKLTKQEAIIAEGLLLEVKRRLKFLNQVGLHYLSIERTAPTLSGGEAQRVRLASHIGSGLIGTTYVLDEPSIGLHPRDNTMLISTLKALRDKGNTVIVVEHDDETILAADRVVDVGPFAGADGGEILVNGSVKDLVECKKSVTGAYLSLSKKIEIPKKRRSQKKHFIEIKGAEHHNLKKIDVKIPLESFVCVTGVSGSGKSSLISDILFPKLSNLLHRAEKSVGAHKEILGIEHLDKVIGIDQSPIGRTPRSNPSTYVKVFDDIRDLFAKLKESQAYGYKPGRFSFNVLEGSCPHCRGMGAIKVDMDFMEDVFVTCKICNGKRFDNKTLEITYKNKNIFEVLDMRIEEASLFFMHIPHIYQKLEVLEKVGLGYLKLGQSSTTLSGGEAQRIKLAKELIRPSTGKTLYILDEPTTGLHFHDIDKLLCILQALVDQGNTVVVIEHNMDFVKTCDYIIDIGPEGGRNGGEIIATGTPEEMIQKKTETAKALKLVMERAAPSNEDLTKAKEEKNQAIQTLPISVVGATQNNLKKVSAEILSGKITVCTGPSGSGKSSFAFETIYAEGQRRYVESLSTYARQFVKVMPKAKVDSIEGLAPAIAIEQKHHAGNPRSTIGTMTEIYDYLRVLYARLGVAFCPETKEEIKTISKDFVVSSLMKHPGDKIIVLAPINLAKNIDFSHQKEKLQKEGYLRIRLNGEYFELDDEITFDPKLKNELCLVLDRLVIKDGIEKRLSEAIESAAFISKGVFLISKNNKDVLYNLSFAVESTGKSYPPITPQTFSFNADEGMCMQCFGLGFESSANFLEMDNAAEMTPMDLILELVKEHVNRPTYKLFEKILLEEGIDPDTPLEELSKKELDIFLNGSSKTRSIKNRNFCWMGIYTLITKAASAATSDLKRSLSPLLKQHTCPSCHGSRLNPLARHVELGGKTLPTLCQMPLSEAKEFFNQFKLTKEQRSFMQETYDQLLSRLQFLCNIGLDYLSLDRSAPTLSGGETQRIFLARQLGSGLTGSLYVLDEPTIGLHPYNNRLLNDSLRHLKELGNTVLLVEHDPLTLEIADYLLDFGVGAGSEGGEIVARGTLDEIKKNPNSLTGKYLTGELKIEIPKKRRKGRGFLSVNNVKLHNLKNISTDIQIGCLTCVSGVSGSGKSSLVLDVIKNEMGIVNQRKRPKGPIETTHLKGVEQFDRLISIDQNPIGQTTRADVSTYMDLLTQLRSFFAKLPQAQARGLMPKHFSYYHKSGMCKTCFGFGYKTVELQFLPPVKVTCEACKGMRLNPLSLDVSYKGKNLGQLLQITVEDAKTFLPPIPKIIKIIETLESVGLGYLQLGQEIVTLSGGEAGRLRLARELVKKSTGKTLYLFDEPTIGLHFDDVKKLVKIFQELVDRRNTVVVIEHNLDILMQSDEIIDLGPKGGKHGGEIIAKGTPEELMNQKESITGKYLKEHLEFILNQKNKSLAGSHT